LVAAGELHAAVSVSVLLLAAAAAQGCAPVCVREERGTRAVQELRWIRAEVVRRHRRRQRGLGSVSIIGGHFRSGADALQAQRAHATQQRCHASPATQPGRGMRRHTLRPWPALSESPLARHAAADVQTIADAAAAGCSGTQWGGLALYQKRTTEKGRKSGADR
jgi:hypothetical protein